MDQIAKITLTTAPTLLVSMEVHALMELTVSLASVQLVLLEFSVKILSTNASPLLVFLVELVLT